MNYAPERHRPPEPKHAALAQRLEMLRAMRFTKEAILQQQSRIAPPRSGSGASVAAPRRRSKKQAVATEAT